MDSGLRSLALIAQLHHIAFDAGQLQQSATVIEGFTELPNALVQLFEGVNTGKLMVRTS